MGRRRGAAVCVDGDPLGTTGLAVGEVDVDVDGVMTDFGVLTYSYDDQVSHLVVGGPYDHRPALAVGVLRELMAAGIIKPDAVLEIVGLDKVPSDMQPRPPKVPAHKDIRVVKRPARSASGSTKGAKRDRGSVKTAGAKKDRDLTANELAVLALLANGKTTTRAIATELSIEPATVRRTMHRIARKLGNDSPKALSAALAKR